MEVALLRESCQRADVVQRGGDLINQLPVRFSSDAKCVLVCCGRCVDVYNQASCHLLHSLRHSAPVTAALTNPRNHMQLMTTTLDGKLTFWDFSDGALLKTVDFKVPLHKFAIRPGKLEPSIFFAIEKEEVSIVGVSSHVITDRTLTTPPNQQLLDTHPVITTTTPRDFTFTYQGAHLVTTSANGKRLIIYDLENEREYKYKCRYRLMALASHPSKRCVATGNQRGEIKLWSNFALPDVEEIVTCLHWHAHSVASLCFTSDGTYVLSGGEEGVLMLWQHEKNQKHFRPRLGGPITAISSSPNDSYFTVSLQSNVVQLVSGLSSEVEGVLGGLRRTLVTEEGEASSIRTGLVLRPATSCLVLNSSPGFLQFYDPVSGLLSEELDVAGLNYVSRTDQKQIVPTLVDHVSFTPSGDWMATVESRDDGVTSPELRLKFWKFVTSQQRYVVSTCVDPPHEKAVTSLSFQPVIETTHPLRSGGVSTCGPTHVPMAVTTSLDQRFKLWVLVDEKGAESGDSEDKGEKGAKVKTRIPSWACRSVSYYRQLPSLGACFSQDGSLLAVNFSKNVTVWDPYSCELRQTFSTPHSEETFKQVVFGHDSCAQFLLASATQHLHVWDLLSCRLLWRVAVTVSYLVSDPFSHLAAALVQTEKQDSALVYQFEPSSPTPLSLHILPTSHPVTGATYIPSTWDAKKLRKSPVGERSTLYFIDTQQMMYSLEREGESLKDGGERSAIAGAQRKSAEDKRAALESRSKLESASGKPFLEVFGLQRKRLNGIYSTSGASSKTNRPSPSLHLLDAAPHVLPPASSLCGPFTRGLLSPLDNTRDKTTGQDPNTSVDEVESSEDEDDLKGVKRRHIATHPATRVQRAERNVEELRTSSYEWLAEHFKSILTAGKST